jgi:crotonobetainyl-CoA:carnitine CoA-transferase CaiB-like acyl-CoA transferase
VLSPYRVLDLTTERGLLCGQILGDLGADVIKVEPPGGSPARQLGPFYHDQPHPDRSLYWWAYNRNKRSITLNLDTDEGRTLFHRLADTAHFLLESDTPGALAQRGYGYADLAALNPALVYVSITPFGQDGPKANYADSDLVILAAGGPLTLTGDEDRPPVRLSVPQAYSHASGQAAVAALIAHHERQRSGRGQHVDVSAQQAESSHAHGVPPTHTDRRCRPRIQRRSPPKAGAFQERVAADATSAPATIQTKNNKAILHDSLPMRSSPGDKPIML